jgi:hypothetical protein
MVKHAWCLVAELSASTTHTPPSTMSRLLGWHAVLAMLCLLSFTTERTAMAQLLLDENVLAFPISVRKSHNTECSPMRSAWLFCDDFENERPGAYIEQRHKAQQRVLGTTLTCSVFFSFFFFL